MIGSFLTVGEQVLILFALMAVGFALGKAKMMGDKGSLAMTNLVMYAVSPAMMVVAFQREKDTADLHNFLVCLLTAAAVHAVSILLAYAALRGKDGTCGVLRFGAVFSNCGFMGYPLMTALFVTIFIDQWEKANSHTPALAGLCVAVLALAIFGANGFMLPALLATSGILIFAGRKEAQA